MTRPQGRLAEVLRRGTRRHQPEGVWQLGARGAQAGMTADEMTGPTAVQLAIQLAQSLDSASRLEEPAPSAGR